MKDSEYYTKIAFTALRRAALEVVQKAHKENQQIPIWKNNHIVHENPVCIEKKINAHLLNPDF